MKNLNDIKFECTGCFACEYICPTKAIVIKKDSEGFFCYNINKKKCINCGKCVKVCPKINAKTKKNEFINCFAAYSKDSEILKASSSGGIFSEFAKIVIEEGGIVIGAAWIKGEVKHISVSKISEIYKLRSSKYLQSDLKDVYLIVQKSLLKGKKVLFSGTPCQIAALNNLFEDKNLFTIDLVCHGVASKKTFNTSLIQRFNHNDFIVDFRSKIHGWHYSFSLIYRDRKSNNQIIRINKNDQDSWFRDYLTNKFLKTDCYNCTFTGKSRIADITLGDFWKIDEIDSNFFKTNNDKGVSLVIINNNKGKTLFDEIQQKINSSEEPLEQAIIHNPRVINGKYDAKYKIYRKNFYKKYNQNKYFFKDRNKIYYIFIDKFNTILSKLLFISGGD